MVVGEGWPHFLHYGVVKGYVVAAHVGLGYLNIKGFAVEQSVEEADEQFLVHRRAEQLLEAEVDVGVDVSFAWFEHLRSFLFVSWQLSVLLIGSCQLASGGRTPLRGKDSNFSLH